MEVIQGAPPAEYGDKTSLVIVATTRSGLGQNVPHGDITASFGSFGAVNGGVNLGYGGKSWGNFVSLNGLDTQRFLDGPEFAVFHSRGNQQNFFDRFDVKPSQNDTFSINVQFTRSWFQTPNSYDMQNATAWNGLVADNGGLGPDGVPVGATDQRSKIRTWNIAPSWTHLINPQAVLTASASARQDQFNYYPSRDPFADLIPDLQTTTVGQDRGLTSLGGQFSLSYNRGVHNFKVGLQWYDEILTERDTFGIVDPTFNPVCLNADGSPFLDGIMDPAGCAATCSRTLRMIHCWPATT